MLRFLSVAVLGLVALVILGTRLVGPHDLYEKDQPKTMAYTADVVLHHRFALPRDVIYQPATKPPLYNWIDAVFVKITGRWDEWVLKLPSLLGAIATGAIVYITARRLLTPLPLREGLGGGVHRALANGNAIDRQSNLRHNFFSASLAAAIWFTFGSDVRHGSVIRLAFLARPDMLQCAFLTGAWALATIAIQRNTVRAALLPAVGFWLCVTGAALTKGPAAVIPIVFAVALALILPERKKNLLKLWPAVGVPLLILCVGGWLYFAYRQDPQHVRSVILGAEVADRIIDQSPEGFAKPRYYEAMWFVTKSLPWGGVAVIGLIIAAVNARFRRLVLPAALYLIIVLACLSLPAGQRMDYLLPAYPPAAVLIAMLVAFLVGATAASPANIDPVPPATQASPLPNAFAIAVLLLPLLLAANLSYRFLTKFHEAQEHWSDNAVSFIRDVRSKIGDADVIVLVRGKHPLTTLLGEHQGSYLTKDDLDHARYVLMPLQPDGPPPLLRSRPLPIGFETLENRELSTLGLYDFKTFPPLDRLIGLQKQVGTWTLEENPYHAPNTVYPD